MARKKATITTTKKEEKQMNDNILTIQEAIMRQIGRIDNDDVMATNGKQEVARSNALSQSATTFVKTVNLKLKVMEVSEKFEVSAKDLNKELGITNETNR